MLRLINNSHYFSLILAIPLFFTFILSNPTSKPLFQQNSGGNLLCQFLRSPLFLVTKCRGYDDDRLRPLLSLANFWRERTPLANHRGHVKFKVGTNSTYITSYSIRQMKPCGGICLNISPCMLTDIIIFVLTVSLFIT